LVPRESFLAECPRWLNWEHFYELKTRWQVSVAALVRRAYDLNLLSDASFRRACIHLRQQGLNEPFEPPDFLSKAVKLLEGDLPLEQLAAAQGLSAADLRSLVEGDHLAYEPSFAEPADEQQSLFGELDGHASKG
jgi:hypothetical protein